MFPNFPTHWLDKTRNDNNVFTNDVGLTLYTTIVIPFYYFIFIVKLVGTFKYNLGVVVKY